MPSRFEGFGLIAVEGMSTGLPIIASDVPGLNEVVSSSIDSCFLVKDANSIDAWVNQIKLCINNLEKNFKVKKRLVILKRLPVASLVQDLSEFHITE